MLLETQFEVIEGEGRDGGVMIMEF